MDCSIDWTDRQTAFVSGDDPKLINRMKKLAADYPLDVEISLMPEDNHGCIYGRVPRAWVKIQPPRKISEEQRAASARRLTEYRAKNNQFAASDDADDKE